MIHLSRKFLTFTKFMCMGIDGKLQFNSCGSFLARPNIYLHVLKMILDARDGIDQDLGWFPTLLNPTSVIYTMIFLIIISTIKIWRIKVS